MSLFNKINTNFAREMIRASTLCGRSNEEEGGLIMEKGGDYEFVKIKNIHSGAPIAAGLYEADQEALGAQITPMIADGWRFCASFHTHPSFSATPSRLDLTVLFRGFKHNVIYATERNVFSHSSWENEELNVFYMAHSTIQQLSNNGS